MRRALLILLLFFASSPDGLARSYTYDPLGNASAQTLSNGAIDWRENYLPFGEKFLNVADADDEGFTGHIDDAATGLTYMQARYYDPVTARFLSNDPVGFSIGQPQMFNRYSYVANDPVNRTDPTGAFFHILGAGALGAVVGAAVNAGVQYATTGEVNVRDAIAAGVGAGIASAAIAANPALAANPLALAALGGVTNAGASVAGDVANGRNVSVSKAVVSGAAGALAVPGGAKAGDIIENALGASSSSVAGEVAGAAIGEGASAAVNAAVPVLAEGVSAAGQAINNGAQAVGGAVYKGVQELTNPDNYTGPTPDLDRE